MSKSPEQNLISLVNASGFLFQLGLEEQIRLSQSQHRWEILPHEYPWRQGEREGFIDLLLSSEQMIKTVIECKRPRDGTWVFLVPEEKSNDISRLRCLWIAKGNGDIPPIAGWADFDCLPKSHESEFCVIRGTGDNDKPLLERLSSLLLESIEGLSVQELSILQAQERTYASFYLPLIVTTANLQVCRFRPDGVNMTTGEISNATFESVPFIHFRKALSTMLPQNTPPPNNLTAAAAAYQRSIIVVNASDLVKLLTEFKKLENFSSPPWAAAFRR